jgi:hypothetical protein
MKKLWLAFLVTCSAGLVAPLAFAEAPQAPEKVTEIKKSIIKALLEGEYPHYLDLEKTGHNKWFSEDFYQETKAFEDLSYVLEESSQYHSDHPFAFDGDKIFEKTGVYIDDIPGKSIVIYDNEEGSIAESGLVKYVLDGDNAQLQNSAVLPLEGTSENLVIFDCLVPELKNCLPPKLSEKILLRNQKFSGKSAKLNALEPLQQSKPFRT